MFLLLAASLLVMIPEASAESRAAEKSEKLTKKASRLSAKATPSDPAAKAAWQAKLRAKIGKPPRAVINIYNTWTHEIVTAELDPRSRRGGTRAAVKRVAAARKADGSAPSWHLRCHFTNEPTDMDRRLFEVLIEAAHHFGVERVEIISGFRAPKYNLTLRKKGRQVARRSHHTLGEAVDFRLPGVSTSKLRSWARGLKLGGVGYYPSSGFVHVDVGKVRTWRGD